MRYMKIVIAASLMLVCSPAAADQLAPYYERFVITLPSITEMSEIDQRNIQCLAINIYYEARGTKESKQAYVAWIVMNRIKSNKYGRTACDVVFEVKKQNGREIAQFKWTKKRPEQKFEKTGWDLAQKIARAVYLGMVADVSHGAIDFYIARQGSKRFDHM